MSQDCYEPEVNYFNSISSSLYLKYIDLIYTTVLVTVDCVSHNNLQLVKDTFEEIRILCQWQAGSELDQKPLQLADMESHVERSTKKFFMHLRDSL